MKIAIENTTRESIIITIIEDGKVIHIEIYKDRETGIFAIHDEETKHNLLNGYGSIGGIERDINNFLSK